jgi:hypothetical protein
MPSVSSIDSSPSGRRVAGSCFAGRRRQTLTVSRGHGYGGAFVEYVDCDVGITVAAGEV